MSQYNMQTVVTGTLDVTIKGVGTFSAGFNKMPLSVFAANVYFVLTGKQLVNESDNFQIVSFNPDAGKLVVRLVA